jgi:hypothetical protein
VRMGVVHPIPGPCTELSAWENAGFPALLSSDEFRSSVGRRGAGHPVYGEAVRGAFGC